MNEDFVKPSRLVIVRGKPRNHVAPFAAKRKAGAHWMSCRKAQRQERKLNCE